jgi:threonine/homoserine/homoserine lactone efflux protein
MFESIYTVTTLGISAGFIFSMPIAGPISIIVTSNALKGRKEFCTQAAIGASLVEFLYVFIVVFGIVKLYSYYQNYMPYLLLTGSLFILLVAYKIVTTNINLDELNTKAQNNTRTEGRKGLRVGILVNLSNPTLLFGWLTSSFMILSLASSLGLNTGGLDVLVNKNIMVLSEDVYQKMQTVPASGKSTSELILSVLYALGVAVGCAAWFILLSKTIIRHRSKLKLSSLGLIIKFLGVCLFIIGLYLGWKAVSLFI